VKLVAASSTGFTIVTGSSIAGASKAELTEKMELVPSSSSHSSSGVGCPYCDGLTGTVVNILRDANIKGSEYFFFIL
jgi:hypothetical protein